MKSREFKYTSWWFCLCWGSSGELEEASERCTWTRLQFCWNKNIRQVEGPSGFQMSDPWWTFWDDLPQSRLKLLPLTSLGLALGWQMWMSTGHDALVMENQAPDDDLMMMIMTWWRLLSGSSSHILTGASEQWESLKTLSGIVQGAQSPSSLRF